MRVFPNSVSVGQTFRFFCYGQTSGTTGTLIFRVRAGAAGTVAGDTAVIVLMNTTVAQTPANDWQKFEGYVTVTALGPTATVAGAGWVVAKITTVGMAAAAETIGNVPTTAPWFIDVTCAMAVAGTFTVRHGGIEALVNARRIQLDARADHRCQPRSRSGLCRAGRSGHFPGADDPRRETRDARTIGSKHSLSLSDLRARRSN